MYCEIDGVGSWYFSVGDIGVLGAAGARALSRDLQRYVTGLPRSCLRDSCNIVAITQTIVRPWEQYR